MSRDSDALSHHPAPHAERLSSWGALAVLLLCALVALAAGLLSWRKLREVKDEHPSDGRHLVEAGHGRTRFVALWGVILGLGFTVATLVTLVAFALVPRCAG